ncbi:MAG: hypothetical protein E7360_06940 [Clostridiales bacterium]|nr:hypothetical protein [Clostridiales bacterium]
MKKLLSLALAGLLTFSVGVSCQKSADINGALVNGKYDISKINIPTYTTDQTLDITAYAGPTTANYAGSVDTINEYHYQKLAEAGFNKVLALYEGNGGKRDSDPYQWIKNRSEAAKKPAMRSLAEAEKFDVKYYVRDWTFYGLYKELHQTFGLPKTREVYERVIKDMFSEENPYIYSPAYGGNFAADEPTIQELEQIAWQVEFYNKYVREEKGIDAEPMINLYPAYVSSGGLSSSGYVTYEEYIDRYFELIAPMVGYVSYDYYPFVKEQYEGSYMKTSYLYNLELMATKCKETRDSQTPVELRTFMQSVGDFTGLRSMSNIGDFRIQIYSALAFGSKEIIYYKYIDEKMHDADSDWGLLSYMTGEYTWGYDCAKTVNNEVKAFADAYLNFDWEGTLYNNANPMIDNANFKYLRYASTSHPRIGKFTSTEDALMTYMKDKDGNDAFMLVNFTDPYFEKDNEVTIQFKNTKALLMYRLGQKVVVPLGKDGTYTFKLYPGEGRFIIPLK